MRTVSLGLREKRIEIDRPDGRDTDQLVESVLVDIAYTLWPEGTAPNLAAAIGKARGEPCPVRTAERYLGGQRDWGGDAVAVIVAEILKRHAMRNVKVRAKCHSETQQSRKHGAGHTS